MSMSPCLNWPLIEVHATSHSTLQVKCTGTMGSTVYTLVQYMKVYLTCVSLCTRAHDMEQVTPSPGYKYTFYCSKAWWQVLGVPGTRWLYSTRCHRWWAITLGASFVVTSKSTATVDGGSWSHWSLKSSYGASFQLNKARTSSSLSRWRNSGKLAWHHNSK